MTLTGNPQLPRRQSDRERGSKELALTITNLLDSKNINYKAKEKVMLESELKEMVVDKLTQKFYTMLMDKNDM